MYSNSIVCEIVLTYDFMTFRIKCPIQQQPWCWDVTFDCIWSVYIPVYAYLLMLQDYEQDIKGWLPTPYEYQCWQTCYFLDTYLFLDFKNDFKKKWVFKHFNSYRRIRKRETNWRYLSSQFRRFNIFRNHLFMAYVLIQLTAAVHWEMDFQENAS